MLNEFVYMYHDKIQFYDKHSTIGHKSQQLKCYIDFVLTYQLLQKHDLANNVGFPVALQFQL